MRKNKPAAEPNQEPTQEKTEPPKQEPNTMSASDVIERLRKSGTSEDKLTVIKDIMPPGGGKMSDVLRELPRHPNGTIVGNGTIKKLGKLIGE